MLSKREDEQRKKLQSALNNYNKMANARGKDRAERDERMLEHSQSVQQLLTRNFTSAESQRLREKNLKQKKEVGKSLSKVLKRKQAHEETEKMQSELD